MSKSNYEYELTVHELWSPLLRLGSHYRTYLRNPFTFLHFNYPLVYLTVGASRMIGQSLFSILLCFQPFERASPIFKPVHSDILSSHLFFCLPFILPPCTVPCTIIFASPVDLVICPYHLNLRFLTVVIRSSYGQITCLILFFTSSFAT